MTNLELIKYWVEVDEIKSRLEILDVKNSIERKSIKLLKHRLEAIRLILKYPKLSNNKPQLKLLNQEITWQIKKTPKNRPNSTTSKRFRNWKSRFKKKTAKSTIYDVELNTSNRNSSNRKTGNSRLNHKLLGKKRWKFGTKCEKKGEKNELYTKIRRIVR